MKDISRSPVRRNDGFHRYLKPGALAQIRNSRINARSTTALVSRSLPNTLDPSSSSNSQISVDEVTAAQNLTVDQVPHLLRKIYGPYSLKRKKLGAARSVSSMMMMNLNPPLNSIIESTGGSNGLLSSDVIAH
ncbi:hypothetical protein AALP_AA8G333100 [Arabis alpina]|uniref:Uncharacterized protein n=1 Tax=Arabis alpina TaxID=50452 RepID=A0A087GB40_ARAAL|nr:hypothetical protein AALP_AA8G333100 [Arabis alpina]